MKWIFLIVLFLGGSAYAGYYFAPAQMPTFLHPEGRACSRMATLCGDQPNQCESAFAELRKLSGDDAIRKPIACVMTANSCAESAGCIAGGGINAVIHSGQEFLKGLTKSVGE